jgi:poly-gamma-glutamate synthesis protein (capsule biosynthesis protein)
MAVICRYEKQRLQEIETYPVDMGYGRPRSQRGRPVLADAELGETIIDRVARLSEAFGTRIEKRDGRGIIRCA